MKGFGIEIKNNLLDPKHISQMGVAVWLYMWLIDKMTSIDEDGTGKILGGKPITYEDIKSDLGISIRTYRRWVSILDGEAYIKTLRTPYGIVIHVSKAYKRFGKRYATNDTSSDVPETAHLGQKMAHLSDKNGTSNKTVSVYSTVRHNNEGIPFDQFWLLYPKKKDKSKAEKKWKKLKDVDQKVVIEDIEKRKESREWKKDGGQFIPYPSTYLNGRRWEDDLEIYQGRKVDNFATK